jgi:ATP-dependent exoDNAse (exonuclease V) beta subunit
VHCALEDLDLTADADAELARQRGKLAAYVGGTADPAVAAAAVERAAELLDGFQGGALAARLHELRDVIVARELPVLLPAEPEGDGPVGFVAGTIDLLYREPESGDYVIADYKTDRVEKAAELEERAGHYAAQGRSYRRAVREALGLDREPRFELWFLVADQVVVIDA